MRWRTRAGMIRALLLCCVGAVLVIVALRGLTHHTPAPPEVARGPARLYSSAANGQINGQSQARAVTLPPIRSTPPRPQPIAPATEQTAPTV